MTGSTRTDGSSRAARHQVPARTIGVTVGVILAVAWPFLAPASMWFNSALAVLYAMIALSLTVLSGWTAQISLAHAAFFGIGTYAVRPLLDANLPLPLAVLGAGAVAAMISLALGVPSLRLRGVYLAIVTLAFGMVCQSFLFTFTAVSGGALPHVVARPAWLASDRAYYLALLVPLAITLMIIGRMRCGNVGRVLFAIRDSEPAAQALGVRLARYKIGVFAFSAAITGVAGGFYAPLVGATPAGDQFGVLQSWFFLAMPVIGGLSSMAGALLGATMLAFAGTLTDLLELRLFLASGVLTIGVLLLRTEGLVGWMKRLVRDVRRAAGAEAELAATFLPASHTVPTTPRRRVTLDVLPVGARVTATVRGPA